MPTARLSSRTKLLAILLLAVMAVFVLRLFYLQVVKHDNYVAQAAERQTRKLDIPAERGEIYALEGDEPVKLVLNETVYTVFADPMVVEEPERIVKVMNEVAGGNVRDNFASLLDLTETRYQILATNVSYEQAEMIKKENIFGLGFTKTSRRVYPEGQLASQVLGFVNAEGVGQYGVEGALDERLTGTDGVLKTVADVRDVPLTIGNNNINIAPDNGDDIVLTIDRNVQRATEKALAEGLKRIGAKTGSALVMNPRTGEVMAMANLPTYDPAKLDKVDDVAVLNNNTISMPYEPGSVIKTFTVASALDMGTITPGSTFVNTDKVTVDDRTITNASLGQTGEITMQHALNWSLNTGMVTIAQRMGNGSYITEPAQQKIYSYFHDKLRLGHPTGIELTGEHSGTVIAPNEAQGNAVRYSNMVFGQGLDVTMLQVATGFSAIINGGTYYQPTVVAGTMDGDEFTAAPARQSHQNTIKPATSKTARAMIEDARQAFYAGGDTKGFSIGGKTGTSETILNGQYIKDRTIATYLGFGGERGEIPSYVVMVEVSSPGMNLQGGEHAMPIFTDISNWMLDYLKLQPKG